jgi:DNA-binding GntR family transcriptional regulator
VRHQDDPPGSDSLVRDTVFARLVDAIVSGALPPGAKISEPQLARDLGVSRAPLREAIRRLEARRLVTAQRNRGARVISQSLEALREAFAVRAVIEGLAAREAALRATQADVAALRASIAEHEAGLDGAVATERSIRAAREFHLIIVRMSGNETIADLLDGQFYPLMRLYRARKPAPAEAVRRAVDEHRRIAEAIEERDGDLAELQSRRHVSRSLAVLEASFVPTTAAA